MEDSTDGAPDGPGKERANGNGHAVADENPVKGSVPEGDQNNGPPLPKASES